MAKNDQTAAPRAMAKVAVVHFLQSQLDWLNKACLDWSAASADGNMWAVAQYRYFKGYRANVRHLLAVARQGKGLDKAVFPVTKE